ncbi:hypothetical protein ACFWPK_25560 [Nocardia sp. NPDC058519]|uniref:hypothetical protein n=1 Tax=Nocardia sp. NPDC058519 TaxID=3346535 RepID=UPI00365B6F34
MADGDAPVETEDPAVQEDPAAEAPLDETEEQVQTVEDIIRDLLDSDALAPLLGLSVPDMLSSLGLPQLPQLSARPTDGSATSTPLDIAGLIEPVLQMASAFGTGNTSSGTGSDAKSSLSDTSDALSSTSDLASSALQAATELWEGIGSVAAALKSTDLQKSSTEAAAQSDKIKTLVAQGAQTVGQGVSEIGGIVTRFFSAMTAAGPFLWTPPGQAWAIGLATESTAEAQGVVAKTQADLTAKAGEMTTAGEPVEVTDAPTGVDAMSVATELIGLVSPLMSLASTGMSALSGLGSTAADAVESGVSTASDVASQASESASKLADAASSAAESLSAPTTPDSSLSTAGTTENSPKDPLLQPASAGSGGGSGGFVGGIGGVAGSPLSNSPFSGRMSTIGSPALPTTSGVDGSANPNARAGSAGAPGVPGAATPAASAARRAGEGSSQDPNHSPLVTGLHGDELVGDLNAGALPVIGVEEEVFDEAPDDLSV